MALVYSYDKVLLNTKKSVLNQEPKARKALDKAGVPKATTDAFFDTLGRKINTLSVDLTNFRQAVMDKTKGRDALFKAKNPVVQKVLANVVMAPQIKFKARNLDLSIHKKGGGVELWLTLKGGDKKVVFAV